MMIQGILFLAIAVSLLACVLLAFLKIGIQRLEGSVGITRDGFPPGKVVPTWSLPDLDGYIHKTPSQTHWQLLVFVDHALVSFPDLFVGLALFAQDRPKVEILILSRDDNDLCRKTEEVLELSIPFIPVDQAFYDRFRVRVMPFGFLLDPAGRVRELGLMSSYAQLSHMWKMAQVRGVANEHMSAEEVVI